VLELTGANFGVNNLRLYVDGILFAQRFYSDVNPLLDVNDFLTGTNHTALFFNCPTYFGLDRPVTVAVRGLFAQSSVNISYLAPVVSGVIVHQIDGSKSPVYNGAVGIQLPPSAFNASSTVTFSRRRSLSSPPPATTTSYGFWDTVNTSMPCESKYTLPKVFWTTRTQIAPNGDYIRTYAHYDNGTGQCAGVDFAIGAEYWVRVTGRFLDLGVSPVFPCGGRTFSDDVQAVEATPWTADAVDALTGLCPCLGATWQMGVSVDVSACLSATCPMLSRKYVGPSTTFGTYAISDSTDIYMSTTDATLDQAETRQFFSFPDMPTASTVDPLAVSTPQGPTDGCYLWESLTVYLARAQTIADANAVPLTSVPRLCLRIAVMELSGSDFGTDNLAIANGFRVFFINDDTGDSYEASTTTSPGSHGQLCPSTSCVQTDDNVAFWIPYGLGKGLRIELMVGNQVTSANVRFSYEGPQISEVNPGTVRLFDVFGKANGDFVSVQGTNFGTKPTNATVFFNGRPCLNAAWQSGVLSDDAGESYITCQTQNDVVGPQAVMLCVAEQVSVSKLYRSDGPVLLAGESIHAWDAGASGTDVVTFHQELRSMSITRCSVGTAGGLYQLCAACPVGAVCGNGSFSSPLAAQSFFASELPLYNDDNTPNAIAQESCYVNQWNASVLADYPSLVVGDTCTAFLACQPASACLGNNTCAPGYEYALYACLAARGYDTAQSYLNVTRDQAAATGNACGVSFNPYTYEYVGNDTACMGDVPMYSVCSVDNPENCAQCAVRADTDGYYGVCQCTEPPRCSLCTIREYFLLNDICQPCPSNPYLLISGLIIAAIAVALLGWFFQRKRVNMAFVTIGIDYFQILAIFATSQVVWPEVIQAIFNAMSVFNFNIDITAPECITPDLSYQSKWWAQMVLPLAVFGVLFIAWASYFGFKLVKRGRKSRTLNTHLSALVSTFIIAFYYLYLVLTKRALDVFNCNPIVNPATGLPTDPYTYTAFTSLSCDGGGRCRCGEPGGLQQQLAPWAIVFLVFYSGGFPVVIALILRMNSHLITQDQYLRAHGIGELRATNPDCYDVRKRYSKIYYQFKPRFATFWILVLLARKFWIAFASLIFRGAPSYQLAIILLILFASLVFQVLWRPFLSTGEKVETILELDAMAERSIQEPAFAVYREIQMRVEESIRLDLEHKRKDKQREHRKSWKSGKAIAAEARRKFNDPTAFQAARYFADLNTLEFMLLGASILICLAGIMFQASLTDDRAIVQGQKTAVTIILVIVVLLSLIYYFLFLVAELFPAVMTPAIEFLRDRCGGKRDEVNEELTYFDPNLNLAENPMFTRPKSGRVDTSALQQTLQAQLNELQRAELENQRLRDEIKIRKVQAQLDETDNQAPTLVLASATPTERREFAKEQLKDKVLQSHRKQRSITKSQGEDLVVRPAEEDEASEDV